MKNKIALQELKTNPLIHLSTLAFIAIAAMLLSSVILLIFNLSGSIDELMRKAQSPDYLQMHQGDIDQEKLENFAKSNKQVKEWQVLEFVNLEGYKIIINGHSQEGAVQDNGLVYQSEKFDFLLDLDNQVVQVNEGEIYLPLMFYKEGICQTGDTVDLASKTFTLKGFFRDSQMNSNMAGSKRLLLHQNDFEQLRSEGEPEYLIEFLLHDRAHTSEFEKAYQEEVGAINGPSITFAMFRMINGLNDGIMIVILVLASLLILLISLFCIRFTLFAKIEDDFREIAVMKAIGFPLKKIKSIYLAQYGLLSAVAVLIGYSLSLLMKNSFLADLKLYMGEGPQAGIGQIVALIAPLFLLAFILLYIDRKCNRIKDISPVKALREGESGLSGDDKKKSSLPQVKLDRPIFALARNDLLARRKLYSTLLKVVLLATFLIVLPQHLATTLNHPSFMKNLGMGEADIAVDIQQTDEIEKKTEAMFQAFNEDDRIKSVQRFIMGTLPIETASGKKVNLKCSFGDHLSLPIEYSQGQAPKADKEIALSQLYLDDLEVKLGDKITYAGQDLEIVGVYSDISNGGKTAKSSMAYDGPIIKSSIFIQLKDLKKADSVQEEYSQNFSFAKVSTVQSYIDQAFGPLKGQTKFASRIALLVSLLVIALVTLLSAKLLLVKDKRENAMLKSVGFSSYDLSRKYQISFLILAAIACFLGIIFANSLGSFIATAMIKSFGVSSLKIVVDPIYTYLICPLLLLAIVFLVAKFGTKEVKELSISENVK